MFKLLKFLCFSSYNELMNEEDYLAADQIHLKRKFYAPIDLPNANAGPPSGDDRNKKGSRKRKQSPPPPATPPSSKRGATRGRKKANEDEESNEASMDFEEVSVPVEKVDADKMGPLPKSGGVLQELQNV